MNLKRLNIPVCIGAFRGHLGIVGIRVTEHFIAPTTLVRVAVIQITTSPRGANSFDVNFSRSTLSAAIGSSTAAVIITTPYAVLRCAFGWAAYGLTTELKRLCQ